MEQYVTSYNYNSSMSEISKKINDTLSRNPSLSVHAISTVVYDGTAGRTFDAIVVFNIRPVVDTLDTPKFAGDMYDNGFTLQVTDDQIPCASSKE